MTEPIGGYDRKCDSAQNDRARGPRRHEFAGIATRRIGSSRLYLR
jgi:hypothetical protein